MTPLALCIRHREDPVVVHYLISRGVSLFHTASTDLIHPSLVIQAENNGSVLLATLLRQTVSRNFLNAVADNQENIVRRMCETGVIGPEDFTRGDPARDGKTCAHVAAEFAGVAMVALLVKNGARLDIEDARGQCPLHLAAARGDYAVAEFIVLTLPSVKELMDKEGQTAFDIAKAKMFRRMLPLLAPDGTNADEEEETQQGLRPPRYTVQALCVAAQKADHAIIDAFIKERYDLLKMKRLACEEVMKAAKAANQQEVEEKLRKHYENLVSEFNSEQYAKRLLAGSQKQQELLDQFLLNLGEFICGVTPSSPAAGATTSPASSEQKSQNNLLGAEVFQSLVAQSARAIQATNQRLDTIQSVSELHNKDQQEMQEIKQQVKNLNNLLNQMEKQKEELANARKVFDENMRKASALESAKWQEQLQTLQSRMKQLEDSEALAQAKRSNLTERETVLQRFRDHPNLSMHLDISRAAILEVFQACKDAASSMKDVPLSNTAKKGMLAADVLTGAVTIIPVIGTQIDRLLIRGAKTVMKTLDRRKQLFKYQYFSEQLGSLTYMDQVALDVAVSVTLYYSQQICRLTNDTENGNRFPFHCVRLMARQGIRHIIKVITQPESLSPLVPLSQQLFHAVVSKDPLKTDLFSQVMSAVNNLGASTVVYFRLPDNTVEKIEPKQLYAAVGVIDHESNEVYGDKANITKYGVCVGSKDIATGRGLTLCLDASVPEVSQETLRDFKLFAGRSSDGKASAGSMLQAPRVSVADQVQGVLESMGISEESLLATTKQAWKKEEEHLNARIDEALEQASMATDEYRVKVEEMRANLQIHTEQVKSDNRKLLEMMKQEVNRGVQETRSEFTKQRQELQEEGRKRKAEQNAQYAQMMKEQKEGFDAVSSRLSSQLEASQKQLLDLFDGLKTQLITQQETFLSTTKASLEQQRQQMEDRLKVLSQDNARTLSDLATHHKQEVQRLGQDMIQRAQDFDAKGKAAVETATKAEASARATALRAENTEATATKRTEDTKAVLDTKKQEWKNILEEFRKELQDTKKKAKDCADRADLADQSASSSAASAKKTLEDSKESNRNLLQRAVKAEEFAEKAKDAVSRIEDRVEKLKKFEDKVKKHLAKGGAAPLEDDAAS